MAVKIRLARHGAKKAPYYRIVVADSRARRDGRYIEQVGTYNPVTTPAAVTIDLEKVDKWVANGAQPTDTVARLIEAERKNAEIMAEFREDIANLVEALVVPLVDDPDAVEITSTDTDEGALLVEISVADEDAGKVIGRQGRVIKAIRTLCRAAGSRNGAAVEVEIID